MTNSNIATAITNDGFAVEENTGSGNIVGKILKFTGNQWTANKTENLAAGTKLVANAVVTAWVHWVDAMPAEHRITQLGQRHPKREELPDLDQSKWPPGLSKEPSDPWRDTRYLHLIDQQSGADFTFVTESYGGRTAIKELKQQIANVRRAHPSALPIVALGSVQWDTDYGRQWRPQFVVVDWVGKDDSGCPF